MADPVPAKYVSTDITNALGKKQILRTMNYRGSLMSTSVKIGKEQFKTLSIDKGIGTDEFVGAYLCNIGAYSCIKNIWVSFENPTKIVKPDAPSKNIHLALNVFPVLLVKDHFEYEENKKEFLVDNFIYSSKIPVIGKSVVTLKTDATSVLTTNTLPDIYYNIASAKYARDTLYTLLKDAFTEESKEDIFDNQRNNMNVALMFYMEVEETTGYTKLDMASDVYFNIEYVEGGPSAISSPEIAYGNYISK